MVLLLNRLISFECFVYFIVSLIIFVHLFLLIIAGEPLFCIILVCCYNPATFFCLTFLASLSIFIFIQCCSLDKNMADLIYQGVIELLEVNLSLVTTIFIFFLIFKKSIHNLSALLVTFELNLKLAEFFFY